MQDNVPDTNPRSHDLPKITAPSVDVRVPGHQLCLTELPAMGMHDTETAVSFLDFVDLTLLLRETNSPRGGKIGAICS